MKQIFNQITTKNLVIIILLYALISVASKGCKQEKLYKDATQQLIQLTSEKQELNKSYDDLGRQLTSTQSIVLVKDKKIEEQLKEIEALKSLDTKIVFRTETKYKTLEIIIRDTIVVHDTDTVSIKRFEHKDDWIAMAGSIEDSKMKFDSLIFKNKYTIEIGSQKDGLFKKKKQMIYLRNENPHTSTTDLTSFELKKPKKWYQRIFTNL